MNMEYWKQFENSGRIEDYLTYAGTYHGDGNGIKAVSGGGVRQTYQPSDQGAGQAVCLCQGGEETGK